MSVVPSWGVKSGVSLDILDGDPPLLFNFLSTLSDYTLETSRLDLQGRAYAPWISIKTLGSRIPRTTNCYELLQIRIRDPTRTDQPIVNQIPVPGWEETRLSSE